MIKVGVFHYPPFVYIDDGDSNGDVGATFSGVDVILVDTVARSLGLRPEFYDGGTWGTLSHDPDYDAGGGGGGGGNGSAVVVDGLLGDLEPIPQSLRCSCCESVEMSGDQD